MSNLIKSKINELCVEYRECKKCPLGNKNNWSWPRGNPTSRKMIVGEAPGKIEVEMRRFFVGPAGQLLTSLYERAEVALNSYYITNSIKCRPVAPKGSGRQNNTPTGEYIEACRDMLDKEIAIINPLLIIPMGRVATERILNAQKIKMGAYVGKEYITSNGTSVRAVFPMYHPSYILRNHSKDLEDLFIRHAREAETLFNKLKEEL